MRYLPVVGCVKNVDTTYILKGTNVIFKAFYKVEFKKPHGRDASTENCFSENTFNVTPCVVSEELVFS